MNNILLVSFWLLPDYNPRLRQITQSQYNRRTAKAFAFARRKSDPHVRIGRFIIGGHEHRMIR